MWAGGLRIILHKTLGQRIVYPYRPFCVDTLSTGWIHRRTEWIQSTPGNNEATIEDRERRVHVLKSVY